MIAMGKYNAKAISGRVIKSNLKGTPGVNVLFEVNDGDTNYQLYWTGWLTEKTQERTFETLAVIGLDESKGTNGDGMFNEGTFLNANTVEIVVDHETYTGEDGSSKTTPKIKWVNKLGGSAFGQADSKEIKEILSKVDLKKEMMVARQKLGMNKTVKNSAPTFDSGEEIPF